MFGKKCEAYRQIRDRGNSIREMGKGLEVINVGSTAAVYSFDYSLLGKEGANLAMTPQPLLYDYRLLQQYIDNLRPCGNIFICLCQFTFLVESYEHPAAHLKYYDCLDKEKISGYSSLRRFLWEHMPVAVMPSLLKSWIREKKKRTEECIDAPAENWMQGWAQEFGWKEEYQLTGKQKETAGRVYQILLEMTKFCKEQGKRPTVILMPFSEKMHQEIPEKLLRECFWNYIDNYKNNGGEVLDLLSDKELRKPEYYCQSLILNKEGKRVFNRRVSEYLNRRGNK